MSFGGIGINAVGTDTVGKDGEQPVDLINGDYQETYILRTAGDLNIMGRKFQYRWYSTSLAGKVRLKTVNNMIEAKPAIVSDLVP